MNARKVFHRFRNVVRRKEAKCLRRVRSLRLELLEPRQLLSRDPVLGGLGDLVQGIDFNSRVSVPQNPGIATGEIVLASDASSSRFDAGMATKALSAEPQAAVPFRWTADYLGTAVARGGINSMPSIMYDKDAPSDRRFKMWWLGSYQPGEADPPGVLGQTDRIYYADSPDGSNWYHRQIVLKGQGGLGGNITADDHMLGSPSVLNLGGKYYMFYEAVDNFASVINRFFSYERGDSWVTSGRALVSNAPDEDYRYGPDWLEHYAFENYPLGFAPFQNKAGTHPVYTGEVQYAFGKYNRYVSLTPPLRPGNGAGDVVSDVEGRNWLRTANGDKWRALHREMDSDKPVPAFWLYDGPGPGREPLYVWFDLTFSNTFVTRGDRDSDDPVCGLIRSGVVNAVPVDLDLGTPGLQDILGYAAASLDGPDMIGSLQNRIMMAISNDGVHWSRFQGPARGGAVVAPQNELTSAQGYDLTAARRGERPHASTDPTLYWDIGWHYGSGYPSALVRDGYLEVYFSDTKSQDAPYNPHIPDVPDDPTTPVDDSLFRGMEPRRVRLPVTDIERPEAWSAARAPGNPSLWEYANAGSDIKWSPLHHRYFVATYAPGDPTLPADNAGHWETPELTWSGLDPVPTIPPPLHNSVGGGGTGRLPTNYPDGQPGRCGGWGGLLGDELGHTVDFLGDNPYTAIHMYYGAVALGATLWSSDLDHILVFAWPVNAPPSFGKGADITVARNAGQQTLPGWATSISAGPANESDQVVDFVVTNDNNGLFAVPPAVSPTGTLTFTPAPNASGKAAVTVSLHDNGGINNGGSDTSSPQTFTITVLSPDEVSATLSWSFPAGGAVYLNVSSYWDRADAIGVPENVNIWNDKVNNQGPYPFTLSRGSVYRVTLVADDTAGRPGRWAATRVLTATDDLSVQFYEEELLSYNLVPTRQPDQVSVHGKGLIYDYYQGIWERIPRFADMTPVKSGILNGGSSWIDPRSADDGFGFRYFAYLNVPLRGLYTFYTESDDGSVLYIGDTLVVGNDGLHGTVERSGQISLEPGLHALRVEYFERFVGNVLLVSWSGPGFAKRAIQFDEVYVPNTAPVLSTIGNRVVAEETALTFTANATDVAGPGGTLTYSLVGAPAGATIDAATGGFTWTPSESQGPGVHAFTVRVFDNGSPQLSDEEQITVTVTETNAAPVLAVIGGRTIPEQTPLSFMVTAYDPDLPANSLTYSLVGAPAGAAINATTGIVSWTPSKSQGPGLYPVTVVVTDGGTPPRSVQEQVTIRVTEVNESPVRTGGRVATLVVREDSGPTSLGLASLAYGPGGGADEAGQLLSYKVAMVPPSALGTILLADGTTRVQANTAYTLSQVQGMQFKPTPDANGGGGALAGLAWSCYEGDFTQLPDFDQMSPVATGTTSNFGVGVGQRDDYFGLRFEGFIDIAQGGDYTFYTSSDDGSKLWIDGQAIVNNDGLHATLEASGQIRLSPGLHPIRVDFFERTGPQVLSVSYAGPGIGKQPIPDSVLTQPNFSFTVTDNGTTSGVADPKMMTEALAIGVTPVNDSPSFRKPADVTVVEDSGPKTVAAWATGISPGPANESGQAVDFLMSNDNTALFAAPPAISPTGTLTFTPAANAAGRATVTVWLHDNGGTSNGGSDTSAPQTFVITVMMIDQTPPTAVLTTAPDVTSPGGTSYLIGVTYEDDVAVRISTLDSWDLLIWGPGGYGQCPEFVSVDVPQDGTPRVATYRITPPGGSWDATDNGTYRLETWTYSVTDTAGNGIAAGTQLGTFQVAISNDLTPPTVSASSPVDGATGVGLRANLVLTFNEDIRIGEGHVLIRRTSDNSVVEEVTSAAVVVSGPVATIVLVSSLEQRTGYYVEVTAGAFEDLSGNEFVGISGATTWNFTTTDSGDVAGFTVTPASGLTTTEAGGTVTFTVNLNSQPTANVTIGLSSTDATEGTVTPTSLTFTMANWSTVQTVTVTGVDDSLVDGDVAYTISTAAATSSDANYNGLNPADVAVTNTDNEAGSFEIRVELRIVGVPAASDDMSDASFAAYTSITSLPLNSTYYGEVWLRDIGNLRGIAGGSLDLAYATARVDATAIGHGSVYNTLTSGTIDEANGLVDNLGGGTFSTNEGTAQWVRLGTATFKSMSPGAVTYTLGHDLAPGASNANFAEVGAGSLAWNVVQFPAEPLTIEHVPVSVEVFLVPRLAQSAASTSADLPVSERSPFWVLEGGKTPGVNHFYMEVWVRSDQADPAAISGGSVTVSFDPQFARAVAIDHGGVYTLLPIENIDNTTGRVTLGGGTLATDKGIQDYALLGRIEFQGNAAVDEVAHRVGPYSLGLGVAAGPNSFALVGRGNADARFKPVPVADVKAVMYDIDDSGVVDFGDFSYFVPAFGKTVGVTEPPYTWWADFDASRAVDFGDFSYFVTAFNRAFNDPGIQFPGGNAGVAGAAGLVGGEAEGLAAFLTAGDRPWQNPRLAADVNGRDRVTPLDALLIVNYIDGHGVGSLPAMQPDSGTPSVFPDVDGDDAVTTLDVLAVCDYLNGGGRISAVQAEGEAPPAAGVWQCALSAADLALSGRTPFASAAEASWNPLASPEAMVTSPLAEGWAQPARPGPAATAWGSLLDGFALAEATTGDYDRLADSVFADYVEEGWVLSS